ncbi:MAG: ABC transporter permease [Chitinophagaceae bacterium]
MNDVKPPRLFHRFFRWYCKPSLRDYIEGDLLELFHQRLHKNGKRKADLLFIWEVLILFRPRFIRNGKQSQPLNHNIMFRNNIKIAWRNIKRHKLVSLINMSGLSIAITAVLFIILYIRDEFQYDKFFHNVDHIFQVNMYATDKGVLSATGGNTAPAVTPTMQSMYPEIESYTRIYRPGDVLVRYEANPSAKSYFTEPHVWGVDSNFLQIFNYPLLEGNAGNCMHQPDAVVITESIARKYFGKSPALGKVLLFDVQKKPFIVAAVLKDLPSQSTFQFDILVPIHAYAEVKKRSWNWFWLQVNSYVRLKSTVPVDKASLAKLEQKFPEMVRLHAFNQKYGQSYDEYVKNGGKLEFSLLPFTRLHLHALPDEVPARLTTLSDIKYIYIFAAIGVFIVFLACVNFMNLSTAQSSTRAKEVGIRKVLGSESRQLVRQFLSEAMLYSFISALSAFILAFILLPSFNHISGRSIEFSSLLSPVTFVTITGLCVLIGFLAGIYPAFYLTSFNPVQVLKGLSILKNNFKNLFIRNGLVIFQFTVSIVLIICTLVVFQQLRYTQNKDMGLNKDRVLEIANTARLGNNEEPFRIELSKLAGVAGASRSGSIPTKGNFGDGYVPEAVETDKPLITDLGLSSYMVDEHFIPTLQIKVLKGRNFSDAFNDSASVILNEKAATEIGWKDPVGKILDYPGNDQKFKVIAVVKDFNTSSLHDAVEPFALFHNSSKTYYVNSSYITVRLSGGSAAPDVAAIESTWKKFAPGLPFDYSFLDEDFDSLYRSEQRMGKIFGVITGLSLFVACLGLFGLSIFTAARRRKEIGIRKVLGASVQGVTLLLSKDFLKLVALSAVIAFPIAWFAMHAWLQDFAYRITMSWTVFFIAAMSALVIALIVISFQSIKAANTNPVKSLRTE